MEFSLKSSDSVYPCEVTIDEDNGRFMIRKTDSSGEVFNSPEELVLWIIENWEASDFQEQEEFDTMMREIQLYFPIQR
ncbi:hypothetical protein ACFSCX_07970 [Bacillus salitolerans]|uniref:Threonine dehydratase n=1 Tax=Bacillus salitolerans TaxID=1437434 RepID=A0ABW4LMV6_9BACI